jgi:hypothetical protein
MYTNATSLAPVPVYPMFFQFRFLRHALVPGFWFIVSGSNFGHRISYIDLRLQPYASRLFIQTFA